MNEAPSVPMPAAAAELVLRTGGLRDLAGSALRRRLEIDPDNAKALLQVGETYRAKGDLAAALRAYRQASAISGPGRQEAAWLQVLLGYPASDPALCRCASMQSASACSRN